MDRFPGVFGYGGIDQMLIVIAVGAVPSAILTAVLVRRLGWTSAVAFGLLLWSLIAIGAVTLLPRIVNEGYVPAENRQTSCSWDIGGPAPDGFWIFGGGQRLLNTLVFVPSAALAVIALGRWRWWALLAVPLAVALLAAYSLGIEITQLELARLDRACDVTDLIDNLKGIGVGTLLGLVLLPLVRPWRGRETSR